MSDRDFRWHEDQRILTIAAAPSGWFALWLKTPEQGLKVESDSVYDLAFVEPVACFALVEIIDREEVKTMRDGFEVWESTGRTENDAGSAGGPAWSFHHWQHTTVCPVWLESSDARFPGVDEIGPADEERPDLIIGPNTNLTDPWIVEDFRVLARHRAEKAE